MSAILSHWLPVTAAVVGAVLPLVVLARLIRVVRRTANRAQIVTVGLLVPAAMALGLSASTSYRFTGLRLGITDFAERMALCATVEAAIIALTLHAWGAKSKASAWLAYALVAVQSIPAFEVSGGAGGIFRIAAGPVLLAVLLHKLLGLEMKLSGAESTGLLASAGRELRERITARLGIGRRGADSAEIARSRAADRAVRLASGKKLGRFAAAFLSKAIDAAQHGLNEADAAAAEASIVARIVRRKSVADLHGLTARHVWSASIPGQSAGDPQTPAEALPRLIEPVIYPAANRPGLPPFAPFQSVPQPFTAQANPFQAGVNNLPTPAATDPIEEARDLHSQGLSYGQIADRVGRSKSWAYRAINEAVLAANGHVTP